MLQAIDLRAGVFPGLRPGTTREAASAALTARDAARTVTQHDDDGISRRRADDVEQPG